MKTVPDVAALTAYTKANEVKDVAVVGGGYIGLEVAENLKMAGYNVFLDRSARPNHGAIGL